MVDGDSSQAIEYGELLTMEPATVYGVWASQKEKWYILDTGEVFNTLYPSVAAAQIQHVEFRCIEDDYVVREFPAPTD